MRRVNILMSTYNGEKYIRSQLDSIINQTIGLDGLIITIRDDGSTDATCNILADYKKKYPLNVELIFGKNIGWKNSFIELLHNSEAAEYYAFSDQDDIWDNDKLESAIKKIDNSLPCLYFSPANMVDDKGTKIGTFEIPKKIDIINTIIQCRILGCTEVFNDALRKEMIKIQLGKDIPHDWWAICTAIIKGKVIVDKLSHMSYIQRNNNVFGGKQKIIRRIRNILFDDVCKREKISKELYNAFPEEKIELVSLLATYRNSFIVWIKLLTFNYKNVSISKKIFMRIMTLIRKV